MFNDDKPEPLPWDYFLTEYERDLLTLTIEEIARKNPNKSTEEIMAEMNKMRVSQSIFEKKS